MLINLVLIVSLGGLLALGITCVVATLLEDEARLRRARVSWFTAFAVLLWAMAANMLWSPDHLGAATPHDAQVVAIGCGVAGLLMLGFAALVAMRKMEPPWSSTATMRGAPAPATPPVRPIRFGAHARELSAGARDRRLFAAIGSIGLLGAACLSLTVWLVVNPIDPGRADLTRSAVLPGIGCGVIFIGFALAALVRRLRSGPQAPGRHSRY